jgi:peptidyl-prolyl cis-trans isomerase SurA
MKRLVFLLVTLIAFVVPSFAQDDTVVEEIIARVNNSIVTRADLKRAREAMQQEAQQQQAQPNPDAPAKPDIAERQKDVLRDLIDQQLLLQKGQDLGVNVDAEMIKRLDELRKQMNAKSMEDLEKAATEQGVSFEDFKQNMKNSMITQQVIGKEVSSKVQVSKAEVEAYYNEHKAEMEQPEQIRLSEILVAVDTPKSPDAKDGEKKDALAEPDPAAVAAAQAKATELLDEIKKGAFFEEVAKKSSNGPTAAQGGDLGMFKRGVLAKALEEKTFAMKTGEVSEPIRTKQGFVILKVTQHSQGGVPDLKTVEPQIQETLYYQRLQPELRKYLTKLREDAYIDIKPGYVDTGASPKQTKPELASANTPASGVDAKKKHKKRFLIF